MKKHLTPMEQLEYELMRLVNERLYQKNIITPEHYQLTKTKLVNREP